MQSQNGLIDGVQRSGEDQLVLIVQRTQAVGGAIGGVCDAVTGAVWWERCVRRLIERGE